MKYLLTLALLWILTLSACAPQALPTPTSQPVSGLPSPVGTEVPTTNTYSNVEFGLTFVYPANWFGPEEYVSGQTLRVEIGSDRVYPYGQPPEQPSNVKNSYDIVIQYDKGKQSAPDIYGILENLQDGESYSTARSMVTRVKTVEIGQLKGIEYIETLAEGAQTERVYLREVLLFDRQSGDQLSVLGQPNNVEVPEGSDWREVYHSIDEANVAAFEDIVASITTQ
jgi:hypothetical protein